MKDVFTLGMRSTQLSESFNKDLKQHLKFNLDIVRFFKHFERAVQEKREKEVKSEHEARKKLPMLKLKGTPVLQQAANVYTPPIFKLFQEEFEKPTTSYSRTQRKMVRSMSLLLPSVILKGGQLILMDTKFLFIPLIKQFLAVVRNLRNTESLVAML
jgi:hypothetical protein